MAPHAREDRGRALTQLQAALGRRRAVAASVGEVTSLDRAGLDHWSADARSKAVRHALANSPFYRNLVPKELAAAAAAGEPGAFEALPFTTRQALWDAYPLGLLAVPFDQVIRVDESSGTSTGQSVAAYFTLDDWLFNNWIVASLLAPVVGREPVAIAVPYELAGVGQDLDRAFEILGSAVVPLGAASPACSPERMVRALHQSKATTLVCSGTRAIYLGEVARRLGIDPRTDLAVDKILMAGEGASPAKVRKLDELWGARAYAMFGMTETNTLAMFCVEQELHLVEARISAEIIDPQSDTILPDGAIGELAVTTLAGRAMPLLRYRTGDLCQIEPTPCRCGLPTRRLRHHGRISERVHIGGKAVSQLEIEDVVLGAMPESPYYFAFDVDGNDIDVSLPPKCLADPQITGSIADAMRTRIGATALFRELDVSGFEASLRASAKPTMRNFLTRPL